MTTKKDNRIKVEIDFEKETLFQGMLLAHEMDITFNDFVEYVLRKVIKEKKDERKKGTRRKVSKAKGCD